MLKLIVRLGKWLETRFPEKVIVTEASYNQLHTELSLMRSELKDNQLSLSKALERLSVLELNAVHKEPVQVLIAELAKVKEDYASFKTSMGFANQPVVNAEMQAMLNGQYIGESK